MLRIEAEKGYVRVYCDDIEILRHTPSEPLLKLAKADFHYTTRGGQHTVRNKLSDWTPLSEVTVEEGRLCLSAGKTAASLKLEEREEGFAFNLTLPEGFNYARFSLPAAEGEAVYGGGVQFSHLNLRGRRFPMWASEAGMGRNKARLPTILADLVAGAGGDYWTTYYPQPSFLSSRGVGFLLQADGYSILDFRHPDRHVIEFMGSGRLSFYIGSSLEDLLKKQAALIGIQPAPPSWVFEGAILGIQGGFPLVSKVVDKLLEAGVKLCGVWTQDWQGFRLTKRGKNLFWNWQADDKLYPGLSDEIQRRRAQGIRWLGYINPYLNVQGSLFQVALGKGYLVRNSLGETLVIHLGVFDIGMIDLTNADACEWYKGIIQQNMVGIGLSGWMADYAEDVTENTRFSDKRAGRDLHNLYPRLWAQLNRQVVMESGLQDDLLIFHRSGYTGQNPHANMQWTGDQLVGWDRDDGLPSAVTAGLSACMSGIQYIHSDAGGYTTEGWYYRTKELLARWCEVNAFSPVLRTHEGNRPWKNAQPWQDEETISTFVTASRMHASLAPYLISVAKEAQCTGIAMLRPFCLMDPDPRWRDKQDAWYLGRDLLIFPVMHPGARDLHVEIPEGEWVHLFSERSYLTGVHKVDCPIGQPAVFYRSGSPFEVVFKQVRMSARIR